MLLVAAPHERPGVAVAARLVDAAARVEGVEEDAGAAVQDLQGQWVIVTTFRIKCVTKTDFSVYLQARGQPLVVGAGEAVGEGRLHQRVQRPHQLQVLDRFQLPGGNSMACLGTQLRVANSDNSHLGTKMT